MFCYVQYEGEIFIASMLSETVLSHGNDTSEKVITANFVNVNQYR